MIADTSAIVAIALQEPSALDILKAIQKAPIRRISAANLLEFWIVMGRRAAASDLDVVLTGLELEVEPVTVEQVEIAREAYLQYGKGSGHGARLNFGDCFAYALAKQLDEPLLFVGDDFSRTDIVPAMTQFEP